MPKYVQSLAVIDDKDYDYNEVKKGNRDDEYEGDYTGDYTDDYYYDDKKWIKIETKEHYILVVKFSSGSLQMLQKTNEIFSRISALASKKRSNKK